MQIKKEIGGFTWTLRESTSDEIIIKAMTNPKEYLNFLDIKKGDVILDIGMNIGGFTVMALSKGAKVIGYEPHTETYNVALKNIEQNKMKAITHNQAVAEKTGEEKLYLDKPERDYSAFHNMIAGNKPFILMNTIDINEILKEYKPNKIKMDCEGMEYDIIMNVKDWYNVKSMIFEFHSGKNKDLIVTNRKTVPDNGEYKQGMINKLNKHFDEVVERNNIIECYRK